MKLEIERLDLSYGSHAVITDMTYQIAGGRITALVGRNGSGKSTLLRAIGRLLKPTRGVILLDGKTITSMPTKKLAQRLAVLPQGPTAPDGVTVRNLVEHGRYPHRSLLGSNSQDDRRAVGWALTQTDLLEIADRPLVHLSGGQQQRAWIAMALAQETEIILLDEPTTFLDVAYQLELMELLRRLNHDHGTTIVMVLHDLNQAAQYSDELVAVKDGSIYAAGTPAEVLTARMIHEVFGLDADVIKQPRTGTPLCVPYGLAAARATEPDDASAALDDTSHAGASR